MTGLGVATGFGCVAGFDAGSFFAVGLLPLSAGFVAVFLGCFALGGLGAPWSKSDGGTHLKVGSKSPATAVINFSKTSCATSVFTLEYLPISSSLPLFASFLSVLKIFHFWSI